MIIYITTRYVHQTERLPVSKVYYSQVERTSSTEPDVLLRFDSA